MDGGPQLVARDELAAVRPHADLLRVAEHAAGAADRALALSIAVVEDGRSRPRVDEVLPRIGPRRDPQAPGQRVAAGVERQHHQLRRDGRVEPCAGPLLEERPRAVLVDPGFGIELDPLVDRAEHGLGRPAAQLARDVAAEHANAPVVLIGPLVRASRDERVLAGLPDAQLTAAEHAVDAPIPVAKLGGGASRDDDDARTADGAARLLGALGRDGSRGRNEQTEHATVTAAVRK